MRKIALGEAMTVRTGAQFRDALLAAFAESDTVVLDTSAISEVDLSFVQTICAARDHAALHAKVIRLDTPAQGAVAALLARGGFTTDADPADIDFWFHGDVPR